MSHSEDLERIRLRMNDKKERLKKRLAYGLVGGLVVGLFYGLLEGLGGGLVTGLVVGLLYGLLFGLAYGLVGGLVVGLLYGLVVGLELVFLTNLICLFKTTCEGNPTIENVIISGILLLLVQIVGWIVYYKIKGAKK